MNIQENVTGRFTCRWGCVVVSFLGLCFVGTSWAQTVVPSTIDPGRVDKKYEEPITPLSTPAPLITVEQPKRLAIADAEKIRFFLKMIRLDGATIYTKSQLTQLYKSRLNSEVSLADIYVIADAITAHYRNDGYILSQIIIPPQTIANGEIKLQFIEGYVDNVEVDGDVQGDRELLEQYGRQIVASRPLRNDVLERYSLLANDLSGAKVKAVLRPSKDQPGAATVVFTTQHTRQNGSVSVDNRGTDSVGPIEVVTSVSANSLLGLYEKISAVAVVASEPREQRYLALTYQQPVGYEGATVSLSANGNRSEPDGDFMRLAEVETSSENFNISYTFPHIRSRAENLRSRIGFAHRNSETLQLDQTSSLDRIRILNIGATYDFIDQRGATNLIDVELSQGLNILNATETGSANLSRANGESDFTKINLLATRSQPLVGKFGLQLGLVGQYSFSELLSSQEFGFGGSQFGRAYDSSEITGDHGAAFKVEIQYADQSQWPLLETYQLYSFYDIGRVWQSSTLPGEESNESASSAGLGLRFNASYRIAGSLELAKPLTRPVSAEEPDRYDWRVFFNLSVSF